MEEQKKNEKTRVFNLIIVDESGSMSIIRKQAFSGMNETLQTIRKMEEMYPEQEQFVTLVTFDTGHTTWHYDNVAARNTHDLLWNAYNPSGATPLYDAMGKAISKLNAQVQAGDKVLVTVITDGEENSSREWTLRMIKNLIEKLKEQGWTFTLIGTDNLDVESMARSFSINEHLAFTEDEESTEKMFARERRSRIRFNDAICHCIAMEEGSFFDDED